MPQAPPETRYAKSGDTRIAYQVIGRAARPGLRSRLHFQTMGSDRVDTHHLPALETRMDDVRAVMDSVGSGRAALLGASEGGPMSILFAATYPKHPCPDSLRRVCTLPYLGHKPRSARGIYSWHRTS